MARKALVERSQRKPKYSTRHRNRCSLCGRPRGYMRKFRICRICFRNLASKAEVPGVTKASW
ncbi:MAG: type Z 30S ribosomal protein S14 [Planctomycetota bacterium]